jgi:serine/threonine-protein kinase
VEASFEIESSLGKYRLIASLARGGMARVYLTLVAGPADFNKLVVLKVLGDGVSVPPEHSVKMFLSEARLAARLVHPNIVHAYEVGQSGGRFFIAMEYLEGQTYRALLRRAGLGGVSLSEHLHILSELARGLYGLHSQTDFDGRPLDVVHRDVSPQNVLIGYDGQVKLLDFGIAETADTSVGAVDPARARGAGARADAIRGKLDYIAPEQLRGENVDHRADVFALGVMLYEALGERRFAGGPDVGNFEKVRARLAGAEPPLPSIAPAAPPALVSIAERALALDPNRRWPSALSFAEALDAFAETQASPPRREALAWRLSKLFEKDRAALRKRVGREIERVRQGHFVELGSDGTAELPRLGSSEQASSAPGSHTTQRGPQGSEPAHRATTAADTLPVPASKLSRALRVVVPARSWMVIASAAAVAAVLAWQTPPDARTHETEGPSVAVGAVQGSERPLAAAPATSPVSKGLAATIHAQVAVTPEEAIVRLDNFELSTPASAEFVRDGKPHLLEASARGYAPYRALVVFDRDRVIDIVLETAHHGAHKERGADRQAREATSDTSADSASSVALTPRAPSRATLAPSSFRSRAEEPRASIDESPIEPGSNLSTRRRIRKASIDTTDPYATRP